MRKKLVILFLSGVLAISAYAQGGFLENWAIGLNAGLYGYGIQGATSLTPHLKARLGFDYMSYSHNKAIEFDADAMNRGQYMDYSIPGEFSKTKLNFSNIKAMIDYYPRKTGIFCFTAGFYVGGNKITVDGEATNYKQYLPDKPQISFDEILVQPDDNGHFDAKVKLGNSIIKPYFGLGLGRTIPKSRLGFKFELGVVYQGDFEIESDYASPEAMTNTTNSFISDLSVSKDLLKLWPMLNFSLTYRIR